MFFCSKISFPFIANLILLVITKRAVLFKIRRSLTFTEVAWINPNQKKFYRNLWNWFAQLLSTGKCRLWVQLQPAWPLLFTPLLICFELFFWLRLVASRKQPSVMTLHSQRQSSSFKLSGSLSSCRSPLIGLGTPSLPLSPVDWGVIFYNFFTIYNFYNLIVNVYNFYNLVFYNYKL